MFWSPATLSHVSASYCFSEKRKKMILLLILLRFYQGILTIYLSQDSKKKRLQSRLHQLEDFRGGFLGFFYVILFNTDLSAATQVHYVGEDTVIETKTVAIFLIGSQTF
jgi:hypothetical protein